MDQLVIPECYVDTNLIETIVPPTERYNHQKGCGTVTKVMKERMHNSFALGIIDKDKQEVEYLKEFDQVHATDSLILHKHNTRHHYIIQISPAIERFMMAAATAVNLSLEDFGLPLDFDELKRRAKTTTSKNDPDFKRFFRALLAHGAPEVQTLANWVQYLKTETYAIDIDVLKGL